MIVYIHGFNSSPASHKANLLRERLAAMGRESLFSSPALPDLPASAIELLQSEVSLYPTAAVTLDWRTWSDIAPQPRVGRITKNG